jgi:HPt (histidine-containing phosphotransfer) domain-containing protein
MADAPIRLIELRGAIRAGESRTVANITQALRSIADALESKPMANRCTDILDAVESQYLETAEDLVTALDHAWAEAKSVIGPFSAAAAKPSLASTAIDPATLEQLTATMTNDGLGLGNQLVTLFLAEAPIRLEGAERAIDRGDLASAKSGVADLKGMCALVGATPLAERCSAFGTDLDPTAASPALGELRREYRRVQETLEPLLGVRAGA